MSHKQLNLYHGVNCCRFTTIIKTVCVIPLSVNEVLHRIFYY